MPGNVTQPEGLAKLGSGSGGDANRAEVHGALQPAMGSHLPSEDTALP
jgi:hypothetical protein